MKIVRAYLQGGLGNQCFIYATARAMALQAGVPVAIDLDYLWEDRVYKRKFALDQFSCVYEICKPNTKIVRWVKLLRYKLCRDKFTRVGKLCIDKRPFRFCALPTTWDGTLTIDGYWQSEKYFYDARKPLLRDFQLKDTAWLDHDPVAKRIRSAGNSVFLHLRSYKEVPGKADGQCARGMLDYYRKAVSFVVEHVENPAFFVFSDDIPFSRELLNPVFSAFTSLTPVYIEPLRPTTEAIGYNVPSGQIRDFTLMRLCKHGIVADSSFSWWAGWLGEQEQVLKGEHPVRIRVNRRVMNDDFWPERWIAI